MITVEDILVAAQTASDQDAYITASISPGANKLLHLVVVSQIVSGTPTIPTVSGGGVSTWTEVVTFFNSIRRTTVFRALTGSSPSSGVITIDFGGIAQDTCTWSALQISGSKLTGTNGADAYVQEKQNTVLTGTAPIALTLDNAWSHADNIAISHFFAANNTTFTGFTNSTQNSIVSVSGRSMTSFYGRNGSSLDISATAASTSGTKFGVGFELAADVNDDVPPVQRSAYATKSFNGRLR